MLSSLALAPDPENDGFLTALEVVRMRVLADLVVLSACETAKGKVYKAEVIVGLTRAFTLAGAPRVHGAEAGPGVRPEPREVEASLLLGRLGALGTAGLT